MRLRVLILVAGLLGWGEVANAQGPTLPCAIKLEVGDQGGHEIVDLEHDRVTRWFGKPAPANVHVALTPSEKDTLCTILAEGHVFDLPNVFGKGSPRLSPSVAGFHFELRMGSRSKQLYWRPDWDPSARRCKPGPDPRQDFLFDFYYRLQAMLHRKAAYRAMPQGLSRY